MPTAAGGAKRGASLAVLKARRTQGTAPTAQDDKKAAGVDREPRTTGATAASRVVAPVVGGTPVSRGTPLRSLDPQSLGPRDLSHLAQLEGANQQLRDRLDDVLHELLEAQGQLAIFSRLQQRWEDETPGAADLVEAALAQERLAQDARSERVLAVLQAKDEVIASFEARYAEARAEAMHCGEQLQGVEQQLASSQVRVRELATARQACQQQLEEQAAAASAAQAAARQEADALREEAAALEAPAAEAAGLRLQLVDAREQLGQAHAEAAQLSETVDAAGEAVSGLQALLAAREEELGMTKERLAAKEQEVEALQQRMARLLSVEVPDLPVLTGVRVRGAPEPDDGSVAGQLARLEAANEQLEQALVIAQQGAEGDEADDMVVRLTAELAEVKAGLEDAEERACAAEGDCRGAQAAALAAEAQLQESLRERAVLEEQALTLQLQLEDEQAAAAVQKVAERHAREQVAVAQAAVQALEQQLLAFQTTRAAWEEEALAREHGRAAALRDACVQTETVRCTDAAAGPSNTEGVAEHGVQTSAPQVVHAGAAAAATIMPPEVRVSEPSTQSLMSTDSATEGDISAAARTTEQQLAMMARASSCAAIPAVQASEQQQQLLELTSQLAAARLAQVSQEQQCARQKAQLDVAESQLTDLASRLVEAKQALAAALQQAEAGKQAETCVHELAAQVKLLEAGRCELSQLRSACYSVVHRWKEAVGAKAIATPEGSALPVAEHELAQQLQRAAARVLAELADRDAAIAHLQQHLRQVMQDGLNSGSEKLEAAPAPAPGAGLITDPTRHVSDKGQTDQAGVAAVTLESSQRAVIRSLSCQLLAAAKERRQLRGRLRALRTSLDPNASAEEDCEDELCTGFAGDSLSAELPAAAHGAAPSAAMDSSGGHLLGMFGLLAQHLSVLERAQRDLAAASPAAAAADAASNDGNGGGLAGPPNKDMMLLAAQQHAMRTAAVLASELPALQATVRVMAAEAKGLAQSAAAHAAASADAAQAVHCSSFVRASQVLSLPAAHSQVVPGQVANQGTAAGVLQEQQALGSVPLAHQTSQMHKLQQQRDKWKRVKQRAKKAKAGAKEQAAATAQAVLQAIVQQLERRVTEQSQQHTSDAQALHAELKHAAEVRAQLESTLAAITEQLAEAGATAEALQQELQRQAAEHAGTMDMMQRQLGEAHDMLDTERSEHAALAGTLEGLASSLDRGNGSEQRIRERVAVLTAAQAAAQAQATHSEQQLAAARTELAVLHEAHAAATAERQATEAALLKRLHEVQSECEALLAAVQEAEQHREAVEVGLGGRLRQLGRQLDDSLVLEPAGLQEAVLGLAALTSAVDRFDVRLVRLEAQAAVILRDKQAENVSQWARLVRSQFYRSAVKQLREGLHRELLDAQAACEQRGAETAQLQHALAAAQSQCERLAQRLQDVQALHREELQAAADRAVLELAGAEAKLQEQNREAMQQAEALALAAADAAAAEAACAARLRDVEQSARRELEAAEGGRQCAVAGLEAVRTEFRRFQALKLVEVKLLEQRVLHGLEAGTTEAVVSATRKKWPAAGCGGDEQRIPAHRGGAATTLAATAVGDAGGELADVEEIRAVCGSDGVVAALREARIERLQREQAERQLAAAVAAADELQARVKAAEQELGGLRRRQGGELRGARERCEALQAELADCQQALKLAKAEGARRLRELQALQRQAAEGQGAGGEPGGAGPAIDSERQARQAAEAALREARQSLARKATLVKELRAKLDEAEAALLRQDPSPLLAELEASQARCRQLSATSSMREAALREARQRIEAQQSELQAAAAAAQADADAREAAVQADLARRDAQVCSLKRQLQELHAELADATAWLRSHEAEASAVQQQGLEGMRQLGAAVAHLLAVVQSLAVTLDAAAAAQHETRAGAGLGGVPGAGELAAGARLADIARLTGLASEDVRSLLEPDAQPSSLPASQSQPLAELQAGVRVAVEAARELEAALRAGDVSGSALSHVLTAVAALRNLSAQLCAAPTSCPALPDKLLASEWHQQRQLPDDWAGLAAEQSSNGTGSMPLLEEQLRLAALEVEQLERRMHAAQDDI